MSNTHDQNGSPEDQLPGALAAAATSEIDERLPYEPPKLAKKRSIARATLFTAMGPAMTGLTMQG